MHGSIADKSFRRDQFLLGINAICLLIVQLSIFIPQTNESRGIPYHLFVIFPVYVTATIYLFRQKSMRLTNIWKLTSLLLCVGWITYSVGSRQAIILSNLPFVYDTRSRFEVASKLIEDIGLTILILSNLGMAFNTWLKNKQAKPSINTKILVSKV